MKKKYLVWPSWRSSLVARTQSWSTKNK